MDWYSARANDELVVPHDQKASEIPSMDEVSQSSDDWYQVEIIKFGSAGSHQKFCGRSSLMAMEVFNIDIENLYAQVNDDHPLHRGEGFSNPSECRESSLINNSAGTSDDSFLVPQDFLLQNSMEQMDDIFLNSFLDDNLENIGSPYESLSVYPESAHESLSVYPESAHRWLSFENFLVDVTGDAQTLAEAPTRYGNSTRLSANEILEKCSKENTSSSSIMPDESKTSEDSSSEPTANDESYAIADADEQNSLEATVLRELEDVIIQLTEKMRICFRDALYRLAENSKTTAYQRRSANFLPRTTAAASVENSSVGKKSTESKTNAIDRTVANLMFSRPLTSR